MVISLHTKSNIHSTDSPKKRGRPSKVVSFEKVTHPEEESLALSSSSKPKESKTDDDGDKSTMKSSKKIKVAVFPSTLSINDVVIINEKRVYTVLDKVDLNVDNVHIWRVMPIVGEKVKVLSLSDDSNIWLLNSEAIQSMEVKDLAYIDDISESNYNEWNSAFKKATKYLPQIMSDTHRKRVLRDIMTVALNLDPSLKDVLKGYL